MNRIGLRTAEAAPNEATNANTEGYLPFGEHGLIGNMHTVALVGTDGKRVYEQVIVQLRGGKVVRQVDVEAWY